MAVSYISEASHSLRRNKPKGCGCWRACCVGAFADWLLQSTIAGSCTHGCAVPRGGGEEVVFFLCCLCCVLSTDWRKAGILSKSSSFYGRESQRQKSSYTWTRLWHPCQAPGPHQAWSDYITKINVVFGCFTRQSGRHLFPAVGGRGDMFSMWKFSKLTEFHSHQSSHTAQQMIQSLQRDFICADSNPLT